MHALKKYRPGRYFYRGFYIQLKGWYYVIIDGDMDTTHPAKSVKDAVKTIDDWHASGKVV